MIDVIVSTDETGKKEKQYGLVVETTKVADLTSKLESFSGTPVVDSFPEVFEVITGETLGSGSGVGK